jgi:hypothetical protein
MTSNAPDSEAETVDVDVVLPAGHTGNTVPTLTVKITKQLRALIAAAASRRGITQSELVRDAILASLRDPAKPGPSAYDLVADLIAGLPKSGPGDLSTNKKYMEGFGLDGPRYREQLRRGRRAR